MTEAHLRVRGDRLRDYFDSLNGDFATATARAEALGVTTSTYTRAIHGVGNFESAFINAVVEFFTDRTVPLDATTAERDEVRGRIFADLFESVPKREPAAVTS